MARKRWLGQSSRPSFGPSFGLRLIQAASHPGCVTSGLRHMRAACDRSWYVLCYVTILWHINRLKATICATNVIYGYFIELKKNRILESFDSEGTLIEYYSVNNPMFINACKSKYTNTYTLIHYPFAFTTEKRSVIYARLKNHSQDNLFQPLCCKNMLLYYRNQLNSFHDSH